MKKIRERVDLATRDIKVAEYTNKLITNGLGTRKEELENRLKALGFSKFEKQDITNILADKNNGLKLDARAISEARMLSEERDKIEKQLDKANIKAREDQDRLTKQRETQMKMLSGAQLKIMEDEERARARGLRDELNRNATAINTLQINKDTLIKAQEANDIAIQNLQAASNVRPLRKEEAEELIKQLELQKQINASIDNTGTELQEALNKQQNITAEENKALENANRAADIREKAKKTTTGLGEIMNKPFYKITSFLGAALRNTGSAFVFLADKAKNSLVEGAKTIGSALKPSNVAAQIKTMGLKNMLFGGEYKVLAKNGEEQVKSTKGLLKPLGSLIGGLGILSFVMKALSPVIEPLGKAIESLMQTVVQALLPIIQKLAAALLPIFIALVNALMPKLLWALAKALQILGFLVSTIGNLIKFIIETPDNIKMMFKTLPLFGGKSELEQMAETLKEGKTKQQKKEIDAFNPQSPRGNV